MLGSGAQLVSPRACRCYSHVDIKFFAMVLSCVWPNTNHMAGTIASVDDSVGEIGTTRQSSSSDSLGSPPTQYRFEQHKMSGQNTSRRPPPSTATGSRRR